MIDDEQVFLCVQRRVWFGLVLLNRLCRSLWVRLHTSGFGCQRLTAEVVVVALTERVSFKTRLQRGNRVQVPKYVRWHYKLEPTQILQVTVKILGAWQLPQSFLSRISKDGRIVIPKLTIAIFKDGKPNLEYNVAEVWLDPL